MIPYGNIRDSIINHIKSKRAAVGITQFEAAEKLNISQAMYSMVENGKRPVTDDILEFWLNIGVERDFAYIMIWHREWLFFWEGWQRSCKKKSNDIHIAIQLFKDYIKTETIT